MAAMSTFDHHDHLHRYHYRHHHRRFYPHYNHIVLDPVFKQNHIVYMWLLLLW